MTGETNSLEQINPDYLFNSINFSVHTDAGELSFITVVKEALVLLPELLSPADANSWVER